MELNIPNPCCRFSLELRSKCVALFQIFTGLVLSAGAAVLLAIRKENEEQRDANLEILIQKISPNLTNSALAVFFLVEILVVLMGVHLWNAVHKRRKDHIFLWILFTTLTFLARNIFLLYAMNLSEIEFSSSWFILILISTLPDCCMLFVVFTLYKQLLDQEEIKENGGKDSAAKTDFENEKSKP